METYPLARSSAAAAESLLLRPSPKRNLLRILLCRHGETDWNVQGRLQGQYRSSSSSGGGGGGVGGGGREGEEEAWEEEPRLNAAGRQQASSLSSALPPLAAVFSSDLLRARETAEVVAGARGKALEPPSPSSSSPSSPPSSSSSLLASSVAAVRVDAGLRERALGRATGFTRVELRSRDSEALAALSSKSGSSERGRVPAGESGVGRGRANVDGDALFPPPASSSASSASSSSSSSAAAAAAAAAPPRFLSFEAGETRAEVRSRVSAALAAIADEFLPLFEGKEENGNIVAAVAVVSHGGAIASAAAELFPGFSPPACANGSITEIVVARKKKKKKGKEKEEKQEEEDGEERERSEKKVDFRAFDWVLLRWADASHVPDARLSGGGAGSG
jgi:broad specificity phosphatase PhoE